MRGSPAARKALEDSELLSLDLSGFKLQSGEELPTGAALRYRVYGQPIGSGAGDRHMTAT